MQSPLEGLRVLDFSRVLAGPFAGRMLSDLGAEVVKLEPPEGDVTRGWGLLRGGLSGYYTQQNAGKESVCVDLEAAGSTELLRRLAARADIVIENFRPNVMARHGLSWKDLSTDHPELIMLSISGFGQDGPESDRPAYAAVIHAESGIVARQSAEDAQPAVDPMLSIADMNAGLHGLVAILAALHLRGRTGRGQHIDIAMLDTMLITDDYANFTVDDIPLVRGGGTVWDATGGPIMITGDFRFIWKLLVTRHGLTDNAPADVDLETKIRLRHEATGAFYRSFSDRASLIAALDAMNLAWGDVKPNSEAFGSPTARARGTLTHVDDRHEGTRPVVQSPYRFSDASCGVRGGPAYRGEHNRQVLTRWLDASDDEIDRLDRDGVLQAERQS
jgi:CoA:oxalate CoA-transferase